MIVCPNCNHQNPDDAVQCEACYTPLPKMVNCPKCGTPVQSDASFCGQCGFNLKSSLSQSNELPASADLSSETVAPYLDVPDLITPEPLVELDPLSTPVPSSDNNPSTYPESGTGANSSSQPMTSSQPQQVPPPPPISQGQSPISQTQIQTQAARLLHIQTDTTLELPLHLSVIHIGKPNDRIPPDIDVSGFSDSEIVSRIHADIRVEAGAYFVEDMGSSNGTYINNIALPSGNRHRLRPGDRIALGKGDKVSFLFQLD